MSKTQIAILDYGLGNIRSICNALIDQGGNPLVTRNEGEILEASGLILPGVGAFPHGMKNLHDYGLVPVIKKYVATGKPVMGICLGMQMLMEFSEEHHRCEGLGFISGGVKKLSFQLSGDKRLPHVGWKKIMPPFGKTWEEGILKSLPLDPFYYFVHSYAACPELPENTYAWTQDGAMKFVSAVRHSNVFGFQFHPEKSGLAGLAILRNFLVMCEENVSTCSSRNED
jgi:glutamine amidotransferase|tara:strand:+ start:225 stop:905 length:681 start_codon:yes stop_codon:yes gene_type:complete